MNPIKITLVLIVFLLLCKNLEGKKLEDVLSQCTFNPHKTCCSRIIKNLLYEETLLSLASYCDDHSCYQNSKEVTSSTYLNHVAQQVINTKDFCGLSSEDAINAHKQLSKRVLYFDPFLINSNISILEKDYHITSRFGKHMAPRVIKKLLEYFAISHFAKNYAFKPGVIDNFLGRDLSLQDVKWIKAQFGRADTQPLVGAELASFYSFIDNRSIGAVKSPQSTTDSVILPISFALIIALLWFQLSKEISSINGSLGDRIKTLITSDSQQSSDDLRVKFESLMDSLITINSRIEHVETSLDLKITDRTVEINHKIEQQIKSMISKHEELINGNVKNIQEMTNKQTKTIAVYTSKKIEDLEKKLSEFTSETSKLLDDTLSKLENQIQENSTSLKMDFSNCETNLKNQAVLNLQTIESLLNDIIVDELQEIKSNLSTIENHTNSLPEIKSQLTSINESVMTYNDYTVTKIEAMDTHISNELFMGLNETKNQISEPPRYETEFKSLNEKIDSLESRVCKSLEDNISERSIEVVQDLEIIKSGLSTIKSTLESLPDKTELKSLQEKVNMDITHSESSIKDKILSTLDKISSVEASLKEESLRTLEKIDSIQTNICKCLEDNFTEGSQEVVKDLEQIQSNISKLGKEVETNLSTIHGTLHSLPNKTELESLSEKVISLNQSSIEKMESIDNYIIESLDKNILKMKEETIEKFNSIEKALDRNINERADEVVEDLQEIKTNLSILHTKSLPDMQNEIKSDISSLDRDVKSNMSSIETIVNSLPDKNEVQCINKSVTESLDKFSQVIMNSSSIELGQLNEKIENIMDKLSESNSDKKKFDEKTENQLCTIYGVSNNICTTLDEIKSNLFTIDNTIKVIPNYSSELGELNESVMKFSSKIDSTEKTFTQSLDKKLSEISKEESEINAKMSDIEQSIKSIPKYTEFDSLNQSLLNIDSIDSIFAEFSSPVEGLKEINKKIDELDIDIQQSVVNHSTTIGSILTTLQTITSYSADKSDIIQVNQNISSLDHSLTNSIIQVEDSINKNVEETRGKNEDSMKQISSSQFETLTDSIEECKSQIEKKIEELMPLKQTTNLKKEISHHSYNYNFNPQLFHDRMADSKTREVNQEEFLIIQLSEEDVLENGLEVSELVTSEATSQQNDLTDSFIAESLCDQETKHSTLELHESNNNEILVDNIESSSPIMEVNMVTPIETINEDIEVTPAIETNIEEELSLKEDGSDLELAPIISNEQISNDLPITTSETSFELEITNQSVSTCPDMSTTPTQEEPKKPELATSVSQPTEEISKPEPEPIEPEIHEEVVTTTSIGKAKEIPSTPSPKKNKKSRSGEKFSVSSFLNWESKSPKQKK